jgi:SAM-dependent methyltransferase
MLSKVRNLAVRVKRGVERRVAPHRMVREMEAEQFGWFNHRTGELLSGFAIGGEDTVVDVGCGTGPACEFAARRGAEVYAVDIDPDAIAAVRKRMQGVELARPFHTVVSDSDPLPLPNGIATRVLAQEVMEHVDDPRRFVAELVRIGRPGARYLLTVPDPASEAVQKVLAPDLYWRRPNHLRVFERKEFEGLITAAGLRIEHRAYYGFFWSMWWALFWCGGRGTEFGGSVTPLLKRWNQTWAALLTTPGGDRVRRALDEFMPKSQIVIARKAA